MLENVEICEHMCTYVKKVEFLSSKFGWKRYVNSTLYICHVHNAKISIHMSVIQGYVLLSSGGKVMRGTL